MSTGNHDTAPLVDSNLLIYTYAEDSPKKAKAAELLERCFFGQLKLCISLQNIGEFCHTATRKYGLENARVNKIAQALLRSDNFIKLRYKESTFEGALMIAEKSKLHFWDAMLAATMLENGIDTIYTEDADFGKIEGIKAVNPF